MWGLSQKWHHMYGQVRHHMHGSRAAPWTQMHAQVPHHQVQEAATLDLTGQRGASAATLDLTDEKGASAGLPQPAGPAAGTLGYNPPGRRLAGPAVAQGVARPD